ncbi:MAG: ribosome assembly RNA-binding protein YhbY [Proteobacteria bacterium]|nr:ribosome assembly RNA-binding protein YhbY [Pseudomonadota bacterium]
MQRGLIQALSPALTGAQRRKLRALAHHLNPIVIVGHNGISDNLIQNLITALFDHELVKVKIIKTCEESIEDIARGLAEATQSACVQKVGRILVFYKKNPDEPKIQILPN